MLFRDDELRNSNEPLLFFPEEFAPTWSLEMRMYPDALGFFWNAVIAAVTTTGDGVITDLGGATIPASCYRHRFAAPYSVGALPRTLMFRSAYSEEGVFWDVRGSTVETIELSSQDQGGCMLKVTGKPTYLSRTADPALTPAYESLAIAPFLKSFASLGWLASTAVTEDVTVQFEGPTNLARSFGGGSKWPDQVEYAEGVPAITGTIQKRRTVAADWDALIAGTRFTALVGFVHTSIIAGAYPYKCYVQGASSAAYTGGKIDPQANARRLGGNFDFKLTRDAAVSSTVEVVNATPSYA